VLSLLLILGYLHSLLSPATRPSSSPTTTGTTTTSASHSLRKLSQIQTLLARTFTTQPSHSPGRKLKHIHKLHEVFHQPHIVQFNNRVYSYPWCGGQSTDKNPAPMIMATVC